MPSPDDRRYTETHEWHQAAGDVVTIGLSQFAVDELTDITYVDFSKPDGSIQAGESFGEIESVKATSELYSGVEGEIIKTNQEVVDNPQIINQDPYGKGWLIKVKASNGQQVEGMMQAADYDKLHSS